MIPRGEAGRPFAGVLAHAIQGLGLTLPSVSPEQLEAVETPRAALAAAS